MRFQTSILYVVLGLSTLSAGCARPAEPRKEAPTPAAAVETRQSQTEPPERASARERERALAQVADGAPVDPLLRQLQSRAERSHSNADAWIALGRAWVRKARESAEPRYYANAEACATLALAQSPDSSAALDLRALVLLNHHRFEEVRQLALQALGKDPRNPTTYGNLSDALLELGRMEEAVAAVQQMIDLKPNLPSYSRASHLRWLHGDRPVAKQMIRLAIDSGHSPKDPEPLAWVLVQAAQIFWHEGDYAGADAGFDLSLQSFPNYPPALVGKGRVALALGNGRRAAELLERAYRQSPLVETSWLLGNARRMAGDETDAEVAYAEVVERGRRSDELTLSLFYSTFNREPEEALRLIEGELGERGDIYTEDAHAWALYRNGRLAEARRKSQAALRYGTLDARLLYHAGAIQIANGEVPEGRALVEQAQKLNPKFDVTAAAEAAELLDRTAPSVRTARISQRTR